MVTWCSENGVMTKDQPVRRGTQSEHCHSHVLPLHLSVDINCTATTAEVLELIFSILVCYKCEAKGKTKRESMKPPTVKSSL